MSTIVERIDPDSMSGHQVALHIDRYLVASALMKKARIGIIFDIACGTGYGSRLLYEQNRQHQIIGVDNSAEAIAAACGKYEFAPAIRFIRADLMTWWPGVQGVGLVCLETIEHLRDPAAFLRSIRRFLVRGAPVVISAPIDEKPGANPFHRHVFSQSDLLDLFSRFFALEAVLDQPGFCATAIGRKR